MSRWAFLTLSVLLVRPACAQVIPPHDWWHTSPNVFENPPTAHFLGGFAWDVFARGPWIARPFRDRAWKRIGVCATGGAAWEAFQVLENKSYPFKHGAWDFEATLVGCGTSELLLRVLR